MSNFVREYRKKMEMTQRDLAVAASLREGDISEIENSRRVPRLETAQRIARALRTTVDKLFAYDKP